MTTLATALEAPYRPRHVRFVRREEVEGWQLKLYGIAVNGQEPRPDFVEATRDLAASVLPQPPVADDRYGVAFATAHDARSVGIALVYWWQSENELHQRIYVSPKDEPDGVHPGRRPASRLRLGARDRRLRAAGLDRGRPLEPGRPRSRAVPRAPARRGRLAGRARSARGTGRTDPRWSRARPESLARSRPRVGVRTTRAGTGGPGEPDTAGGTERSARARRTSAQAARAYFDLALDPVLLHRPSPSKCCFLPLRDGRSVGGLPSDTKTRLSGARIRLRWAVVAARSNRWS